MPTGIADVSAIEALQSCQNAKFGCGSGMSVFNQDSQTDEEKKVENEDEEKDVKNTDDKKQVKNTDKKDEVKNEDKKEEGKTVVNINISRS